MTHVNALIDDALGKGAAALTGGKSDGVLMRATVIDKVTADDEPLSRRELRPGRRR